MADVADNEGGAYEQIRARIERLSGGRCQLLAVSKLQPACAIRDLYQRGQRAFGENYVQEASSKMQLLHDLPGLVWHLIGPLQSNKAMLAAHHFDWVHSVDRAKLVPLLARGRGAGQPPLNVLIQVNIDDEASKQGCQSLEVPALAAQIKAQPKLRLRGLMAIPDPDRDPGDAFTRMATLQSQLAKAHAHVDTLSMGMSADYPQAISCGATLVRLGTALFGMRSASAKSG